MKILNTPNVPFMYNKVERHESGVSFKSLTVNFSHKSFLKNISISEIIKPKKENKYLKRWTEQLKKGIFQFDGRSGPKILKFNLKKEFGKGSIIFNGNSFQRSIFIPKRKLNAVFNCTKDHKNNNAYNSFVKSLLELVPARKLKEHIKY